MIDNIWIHGQGTSDGQEYLVRLITPRCVIRLGNILEEVPEGDSFANDFGEEFAVEEWIDPRPPTDKEVEAILRSANDANEKFTRESYEDDD